MSDTIDRHTPVPDDMRFQQASWRWERIGWCLLALIPLLALTGLFSNGPLSSHSTATPTFTIHHERFQRISSLTRFRLQVAPQDTKHVALHFGPPFIDLYDINSMQPQPVSSHSGDDGLRLVFEPPTSGELQLSIWAWSRRIGIHRFDVSDGRNSVQLFVLIYP
jgi:hypothetical protein